MKKVAVRAAGVLLLVFLTACAQAVPSSSAPESTVQSASIPESASQPVPSAAPVGTLTFFDFADGSANGDGYYEILSNATGSHTLTGADFASGQRRILCDRPGCAHADENCPAFVACSQGQPRLLAQENRLVLVHPRRPALGQTPAVPARVEVRALDGTGSCSVFTFSPDEEVGLYFALDESNLYALVRTLTSGGSVTAARLERVNLESGVSQTLARLDHPQDNILIQGVWENRVILKRIFEGGTSRQLPTEDWDLKINSQIHSLFFLDDQGQEQTLTQWRQYQAAGFVYGDACYLFYENGDLHKVDFPTKKDIVLASFGPEWGKDFVTCPAKIGKMLVVDLYPRDALPGQAEVSRFAVDTVQGGAVPLTQQTFWEDWRQPVPILYADDRRVLAVWGTRSASPDFYGQSNGQSPIYGLMDAAGFLSGGQAYTELPLQT